MKKYYLVVILVVFSLNAGAGTIDVQYVASIVNTAPKWLTTIIPAANKIFLIVWFFETATQCITKHLFELPRYKELFRFLFIRIIFMSFFTFALMRPDLYLGVIQYLVKIGQAELSGISGSGGGGVTGIDAGWVWQQYADWFLYDYTPAINALGVRELGQQFSMGFGNVIYFLCTCFLCFLIIMMEIQITVIVYGALILTGFAGSKWTKHWWNSYLGACVSVGLKVMIFCFLYSVLQSAMTYKTGNIQGASDVWSQIAQCILCTLAIAIIPGRVAGMISNAGAADFGGDAVASVMTMMALGSRVGNTVSSMQSGAQNVAGASINGAKAVGDLGGKAIDFLSGKNTGSVKGSGGQISQQPLANKQDKSEFLNGQN